MAFNYTVKKIADGLGCQLHTLSILVNFAEKYDISVICDIRTFPYFLRQNKSHIHSTVATDLVDFHSRIIHDTDRIDAIPRQEILDWNSSALHHSILEWLIDGRNVSDGISYNAWEHIIDKRYLSEVTSSIKMPIQVKDRALIDKYKSRVQDSITVHARLGNGEADMMLSSEDRATGSKVNLWENPDRLNYQVRRISPDRNKFITEMKRHSGASFFICTDTLSFFEQCKDIFGDRVYSIDRNWIPAGWGPGHNISMKPYSAEIKSAWKNNPLDPWELICTDLTDMELMCESKHMICNASQFNYFARAVQEHTIVS